jgi:hypothetical protein
MTNNDIANIPIDPPQPGDGANEDMSGQPPSFKALIEEAEALTPGDDRGVIGLLVKGAALHLTELQADILIRTIHRKTKIGLKQLRKTWTIKQEEVAKREYEAGAEERERTAAEWAAGAARARRQYKDRMFESCRGIAEDPALLDRMEEVVHALGAVGEGRSIRQIFLTCASRLLDGESMRLLRVGAPSSGKNLVVEKVLMLFPEEEVVRFSGASPKALAYFGGLDPDSLKGRIVYLPEAAILMGKDGVASDFTIMLRTLISEGRVVYQTVVLQKNGPPETISVIKNGPIAAILTCARDIDQELKTRTLINDSDESGAQTARIFRRILSNDIPPAPDLQPWLDLQQWLMADGATDVKASYRVAIPFKDAVHAAFEKWRPQFLEGAQLRGRRDLPNILCAIKAAALLYQAQRMKDADGAIVATLDDYRAVHEAFDADLGNVHGSRVSEKTLAVVRVVEELGGADADLSVKVTLRALATKLGIVSLKTAGARLMEAVDHGAIEQDDSRSSGQRGARYFRVVIPSKDLAAGPGLGVLPPPSEVAKFLFGQGSSTRTGNKGNEGNERAKI